MVLLFVRMYLKKFFMKICLCLYGVCLVTAGDYFSGSGHRLWDGLSILGVGCWGRDATARHSPSVAWGGLARTSCPGIAVCDRILRPSYILRQSPQKTIPGSHHIRIGNIKKIYETVLELWVSIAQERKFGQVKKIK